MKTKKRTLVGMYGGNRVAIKLVCGPGKTLQDHKDECDINIIVKRGLKTGYLVDPTKPRRQAMFGDFTGGADFEAAQNAIASIKSEFLELPSEVRTAYDNSPAKFMDALKDPEQKQKLTDLGVFEIYEKQASMAEEIGACVADALKPEKQDEPAK